MEYAGLCEVCPSTDRPLMVFPSHKCGSIQLVVSYLGNLQVILFPCKECKGDAL